jgi:hypothetical protein
MASQWSLPPVLCDVKGDLLDEFCTAVHGHAKGALRLCHVVGLLTLRKPTPICVSKRAWSGIVRSIITNTGVSTGARECADLLAGTRIAPRIGAAPVTQKRSRKPRHRIAGLGIFGARCQRTTLNLFFGCGGWPR